MMETIITKNSKPINDLDFDVTKSESVKIDRDFFRREMVDTRNFTHDLLKGRRRNMKIINISAAAKIGVLKESI